MIGRCLMASLLVGGTVCWGGQAVYEVRGVRPQVIASNGFVQTVVGASDGWWRVSVTTSLSPIGAEVVEPGRPVARDFAAVPPGFRMPLSLTDRVRREDGPWARATIILEWVDEALELDTTGRGPQDAASVLNRGTGRCSGIANAAVGLLRAGGVSARTVGGVLVGPERTVPHRWLECHLPGAGWVPSDPTLGLWVVTPRHVVYPEPLSAVPELRVVELDEVSVDELPKRNGRPFRGNRGAQLLCRLIGFGSRAFAVLEGPERERRFGSLDPEAVFDSLSPGQWRLRIVSGGRVVRRIGVLLREGDHRALAVHPLAGGAGS